VSMPSGARRPSLSARKIRSAGNAGSVWGMNGALALLEQ